MSRPQPVSKLDQKLTTVVRTGMRVNKNGYAQYVPPLTAGSPASNVKQLLTKYGL